jgi:hypothetical protein
VNVQTWRPDAGSGPARHSKSAHSSPTHSPPGPRVLPHPAVRPAELSLRPPQLQLQSSKQEPPLLELKVRTGVGGGGGGGAASADRGSWWGVCPESWLAEVAHDVLHGLTYLHRRRRIHRDIKPGNLLIDKHGKVCVCVCAFDIFVWISVEEL